MPVLFLHNISYIVYICLQHWQTCWGRLLDTYCRWLRNKYNKLYYIYYNILIYYTYLYGTTYTCSSKCKPVSVCIDIYTSLLFLQCLHINVRDIFLRTMKSWSLSCQTYMQTPMHVLYRHMHHYVFPFPSCV